MMDATKSCSLRKFLSELSCFLQNLLTREPGPCRIFCLGCERFEIGTALDAPLDGGDAPMNSPLCASVSDIFISAWPLCSISLNNGISGIAKPMSGTVNEGAPRNDCP